MSKPTKKNPVKQAGQTPRPEQAGPSAVAGWCAALRRIPRPVRMLLFAVVAAAVAIRLNFLTPAISDPDAFYHLRHASIYAAQGLFLREFPWVTCSVIGKYQSDIWYGFHLLLIPFSYIGEASRQIKLTNVFLLTVSLSLFYWVMRRSRLPYPFLWPFVLLFSGAIVTGRLTMTRPHLLSLGLAALLLSFMIEGGVWGVFLISLGLAFFHLSFFWFALLVAVAVALVKLGTEKKFEWRKLLAVLGGLAVGWLLRPNPLGAAKLLYVQVFQVIAEKQKDLLILPNEMKPLLAKDLYLFFAFFTALWLALALIFVVARVLRRVELSPQQRTLAWTSLALSLLFFVMMLGMSLRSMDQWALFAAIFVAASTSFFFAPGMKLTPPPFSQRTRYAVAPLLAVMLVFMAWYSFHAYSILIQTAVYPDRFRGAGEWLREHSRPGEVVFHADWDVFPELFFRNSKNYYIGGMDPIFQYAYSQDLYWKAQHISANQAAFSTWGTKDAEGVKQEETYTVLRRDFKASYVFLQKRRTATFFGYLSGDVRFIKRYEDAETAVFEISRPGPVTSGAGGR